MSRTKKNADELKIRIPPDLKSEVMKATADKPGGASALVRELLEMWIAKKKSGKS